MTEGASDVPLFRIGERKKLAPRKFVIGGFLGAGDAMLLIGGPKTGKSALAVSAAFSVATGNDFFGRRVWKGAVIYVAAERYGETDLRLQIAFRGHNGDEPPMRMSPGSRIFVKRGASGGVAEALASAIRLFAQAANVRPVLVVFDTVAALLRQDGGDENDARDVGTLTLAIDKIRMQTGAAALVIHHSKRGEHRSRGSDALEAWAETVAEVNGGSGDRRRLTVLRSNTIDDGVKATFALSPVDLGEDPETGTPSSVVMAVPAGCGDEKPSRTRRLSADAELAFAELQKLPAPVLLDDWRSAAIAAFGEREPGTLRQAFSAARKRLEAVGLVSIDGQNVSVSGVSE